MNSTQTVDLSASLLTVTIVQWLISVLNQWLPSILLAILYQIRKVNKVKVGTLEIVSSGSPPGEPMMKQDELGKK